MNTRCSKMHCSTNMFEISVTLNPYCWTLEVFFSLTSSRSAAGTGSRLGQSMLSSKRIVQWTQILSRDILPLSAIKQYEHHYSLSPSARSCLAVKKCMYPISFASLSPTDTPLSSSPGVFIPFPHIYIIFLSISLSSSPTFLQTTCSVHDSSPFHVEFMRPFFNMYLFTWPFLRSIIKLFLHSPQIVSLCSGEGENYLHCAFVMWVQLT